MPLQFTAFARMAKKDTRGLRGTMDGQYLPW
jgi:hypothetical protein